MLNLSLLKEFNGLLRSARNDCGGRSPPLEGVVEKIKGTVVELVETTVPFIFAARGRRPCCILKSIT